MKRRDFIVKAGTASLCAAVLGPSATAQEDEYEPLTGIDGGIRPLDPQIGDRSVTCAVIGAGGRGNAYESYIRMFPDKVKLAAVSDINDFRRNTMADRHNLPAEKRFGDFREFFAVGKICDCVFICLPDYLHYPAAMEAIELGYDVLLEKPMAQSAKECTDLLEASRRKGIIMGTCHVLRYAPYFVALRQAVQSGLIGKVNRIQHMEYVERVHMSHSYVRGNWHNSVKTTPIILSKSCHDLDLIRWILGVPYKTVSAQGELTFFKKENAPVGATARCIDGCPHEGTCPFSSVDIYLRRKSWLGVMDRKTGTDEEIEEFLRTSDYGRCVYDMDNDQPDFYSADFEFEGGATGIFIMEALTPMNVRRTLIMGSKGSIEGDEHSFLVSDFRTRKTKKWTVEAQGGGHGGGDHGIARDFIEAVALKDPSKLSSTIDVSMESHLVGFLCEKSRLTGEKLDVNL